MGTKLTKSKTAEQTAGSLLYPAIEGDLDKIKELVGIFLASYSHQKVGFVDNDPKLQNYVNQLDAQGNSAIYAAAFAGHLEIVQYLHEQCGASIHLGNHLGCTPLWLAAGYNQIKILDYLLTKIINKDELLNTNTTGDTCLIAAASRGNLDACRVLLDTDQKEQLLTMTNAGGDGALAVAVAGGHTALLDILLPSSSINQHNQKGVTPLLVACERDDVNMCKKLLEHGASLDVTDATNGASPLAVTAFCGSDTVMEYLLLQLQSSHSALLEQTNMNGCTPLWLAARSGRDKTVKLLLEAGANPHTPNKDGLTPVDVARNFKREKVMELFNQIQPQQSTGTICSNVQ